MELETEVSRGDQARELMEHPLLVEAFDIMRAEIMGQWESSPARDSEGREKLWQLVKQLERLKGHLQQTMETGKMARIQLAEKQTLAERAKQWINPR